MVLTRTCKQVAALLVAREDRLISLSDEAALKLHLLACDTCPKFEAQILTLRAAMKRWRHDTDDADGMI